MLEFRRILAFSSRIHTYLMALYLFFASLMTASFFTSVEAPVIGIVSTCMAVLGWLIAFEGVWIILASFYQLFYSHVFAFSPVLLTLLRGLAVLLIASVLDFLEMIVTGGLSI